MMRVTWERGTGGKLDIRHFAHFQEVPGMDMMLFFPTKKDEKNLTNGVSINTRFLISIEDL